MGFWSFIAGTVGTWEFLRWSASGRKARRSSWDWGNVLKWIGYVLIAALIVDIGLVIILVAPFCLAAFYLTKPKNWAEERWRIYVLQFACPPVGWYGLWKSQSMAPFEKTFIVIGWIMLIVLCQHAQ
jgi:hypothetical protein